jgi:hypothetical protein
MIANAITVRDGALQLGEPEVNGAPRIATASWLTAVICRTLLARVAVRMRSMPRRPSSTVLWIAGLCG